MFVFGKASVTDLLIQIINLRIECLGWKLRNQMNLNGFTPSAA